MTPRRLAETFVLVAAALPALALVVLAVLLARSGTAGVLAGIVVLGIAAAVFLFGWMTARSQRAVDRMLEKEHP